MREKMNVEEKNKGQFIDELLVVTGDNIPDVGPSGCYAIHPGLKLTTTWRWMKR